MTDLWSKKKKVLTRKERFRITDDLSRKKDKEENVEKLVLQKEEQIERLEWEQRIKYEKADKEQVVRRWRLKPICNQFRDLHETTLKMQIQSRAEYTVSQYPEIEQNLNRIVPWINERLSKWQEMPLVSNACHLRREIDYCFSMLQTLTAYIDYPLDISNLNFWCQCRRDLRDELYRKFDHLSYRVLKNIEKTMSYLSADIMYHKTDSNENFSHALWTVPHKPDASKEEKFPLHCHFEEFGVTVSLPKSFQHQPFAVRCLVVLDDYFSPDCPTYLQPESPECCKGDFDEYHNRIWLYKEERRQRLADDEKDLQVEWRRRQSIINKIKHLIPCPSVEDSGLDNVIKTHTDAENASMDEDMLEAAPQPKDLEYLSKVISLKRAYAQFVADEERLEVERVKGHYTVDLDKHECNMRKYYIVGGVYHINLLKQPPQPKILRDGAILRIIEGEDHLQTWSYLETYEPPAVKAAGPLKHSTDDDDEDAENTPEGTLLSKLVLVVMKLPDHVLWFDAPQPVHWDFHRNYWSSEYIYDSKFNEEKQTISFRAGIMTAFGLAVFRYNNFPFQSWELKFSDANTSEINFNLTTSTLVLEFRIRKNEVCLAILENANTTALQELVDVYYEPMVLVRLLRNGGVNIFPGDDGCLYVDGTQLKHRVTENHIYHCLALLCCCGYQFNSCRWNMMAGYKKFVFQALDADTEKGKQLMVVTDERAFFTESADVTQALNECEGMQITFYPDLMSLAEDCCANDFKKIVESVDPILEETIYFMLSQTRILSLS